MSAIIGAPFAIACLAVADYVLAAVRPATTDQVWLWYTATHFAGLTRIQLVFLLLAFVTLVASARRVKPFACEVALVVEFLGYFLGTKIWPPTGDQMTWYQNAATPNVSLSEPLADVVHKVPFWVTGDLDTVRFVAPAFGLITVIIGLALARRLSSVFVLPRWPLQAALVVSPLPFWYVTGYIENTFLAIPFLMLGIWFLCGMAMSKRSEWRSLAGAGAMFVIAGLFHAGFAIMCAPLVVWLLIRPGVLLKRRLRDLGVVAAAGVVTVVIAVGSIALLPVRLAPGNSQGGYDGDLFVSFVDRPNDPMFHFVFASHAHLIQFSNILVHAAPPIVLAIPVLLLLERRRRRREATPLLSPDGCSVLLLLCAMSLAYIAFAAVWGFDLGQVGDLDLMLTMDMAFVLAVVVLAASVLRRRPIALAALLVASGLVQFGFYAMKVADVWVR